jgi:serine/threonine protein phosphatase PrpC
MTTDPRHDPRDETLPARPAAPSQPAAGSDFQVERLGTVEAHGMRFDVAAASGQGPRNENQDAFSVASFPALGLVAVADGMGGERAGRMAADTALQAITGAGPIRSLDAARYAVRAADEAVARTAQEMPAEREGMGCALAVLSLTADRAGDVGWVAAHVGDVRVLSRSPDGVVRLETRDHTQAFARWEAGEIALDEIPDSPGANRLQRAVGRGGEADAGWIPVKDGWSYLLVSDGITKAMRLDELGDAMATADSAAAVEAIARKVEERGPDDNYMVVAVRVLGDGAGAQPRAAAAGAARSGSPASHETRGPFNPPANVNRSSRSSPLGALAALLSVLALALAGYALMNRPSAAADPAMQARVDSLENQMAALREQMTTPLDTVPRSPADTGARPVAPPAGPPAAAPAGPTAPATQGAPGAANRTP